MATNRSCSGKPLASLRQQVVGNEDGEFSIATLSGDELELRELHDELSTVAMFGGGQRLIVVDDADVFISANRAALEQYVAKPKRASVLALVVRTWPGNTRLAKLVVESGRPIECKCPSPAKLAKWLITWARQQHDATLEAAAAETLLDQVEPELGLLDQELAKLAALAGAGQPITPELVREAVGGWRTKTAWDLLDAMLDGHTSDALVQLDRLLLAGEAPIALLGQVSASLRRFAAAARLVQQGEAASRRINLRQALEQAGVKSFVLAKSEGQLRRLGRERRCGCTAGCWKPIWPSKEAVLRQHGLDCCWKSSSSACRLRRPLPPLASNRPATGEGGPIHLAISACFAYDPRPLSDTVLSWFAAVLFAHRFGIPCAALWSSCAGGFALWRARPDAPRSPSPARTPRLPRPTTKVRPAAKPRAAHPAIPRQSRGARLPRATHQKRRARPQPIATQRLPAPRPRPWHLPLSCRRPTIRSRRMPVQLHRPPRPPLN